MDVSRRTSGVMDLDTFRRATDMLESDSASRMSMDIYDIYDEMLGSRTNSLGGGGVGSGADRPVRTDRTAGRADPPTHTDCTQHAILTVHPVD